MQDYSALNLLLSDGANLYALCAYTRDPEYFTLWIHEGPDVVVVASEPVDAGRPWQPLAHRELLCVLASGERARVRLP